MLFCVPYRCRILISCFICRRIYCKNGIKRSGHLQKCLRGLPFVFFFYIVRGEVSKMRDNDSLLGFAVIENQTKSAADGGGKCDQRTRCGDVWCKGYADGNLSKPVGALRFRQWTSIKPDGPIRAKYCRLLPENGVVRGCESWLRWPLHRRWGARARGLEK